MAAGLQGKTILITGASRGIGAATAHACVAAGARPLLHASRPSEAADAVTDAIGARLDEFLFEDLNAEGAGARLVARAIERVGALDGVVNNAGVFRPTPLAGDGEAWRSGWEEQIAVNLRAPADLCRAAIAHFRDTGQGGSIVNIASRAGHRGDAPDFSGYAATKGALLAMTKTFARALSGENILVYAVAPGWVETRMAPEDIAARKKALDEIPLGRVAAPDEIAALVAFLLSGACPSATGATFDVNGASYVR